MITNKAIIHIGRPSRVRPTASASLAAPPADETMVISSASPEQAAIPEFGVSTYRGVSTG